MLNPRWIVLLLSILISFITCLFLNFTGLEPFQIFVAFISSFSSACIFGYLLLDFFIFKEVKKINTTIKNLKSKGFKSKSKQFSDTNSLKNINTDLATYATQVELEITGLKKAEQFRKEFLANVSHELKTPIFAAQGFVHTLIEGAKDDLTVRDNFLEKAAKSLDGLDILVRDLVSLSQMETGDIKMNQQETDLYKICVDTVELLDKKAQLRKVTLAIIASQKENYMVKADEFRMAQVMNNLIENAIKYGNEAGKVTIRLVSEKKSVKVQVIDNGPGISKEHQLRIFERFYRIEKSRSRELGGSGLGLAIVKHILAGHGSKIKVDSEPNKGTTMTFKLESWQKTKKK